MAIFTEKHALYFGVGFFGFLYLMSHFRFLRPANAASLQLFEYEIHKE